jgi:hypothetical protein
MNIDSNAKTVVIYSQKLCGWLMFMGFVLVDMRPSNAGDNRNVFFFKNSEQIRRKITEYNLIMKNFKRED